MRLGLASALALALACGYGFSQRYVARGGATAIHVRPFENRSSDPELGAVVADALRTELSRRGADAGEGAAAEIDGEVRADEPVITSSGAATWRVAVTVRARLVGDGKTVAEHVARREAEFVGGEPELVGGEPAGGANGSLADPLETEGRRALALRRAAGDAARDVLRAFER